MSGLGRSCCQLRAALDRHGINCKEVADDIAGDATGIRTCVGEKLGITRAVRLVYYKGKEII